MILLPATRPLYAALDPFDFRRSFDVLFATAREQRGLDALRRAIVLFLDRVVISAAVAPFRTAPAPPAPARASRPRN